MGKSILSTGMDLLNENTQVDLRYVRANRNLWTCLQNGSTFQKKIRSDANFDSHVRKQKELEDA